MKHNTSKIVQCMPSLRHQADQEQHGHPIVVIFLAT